MTEQTSIDVFDSLEAQLQELRQYDASQRFDYESREGEKAARSHVYSLRRTKTAVDEARKNATRPLRERVDAINAKGKTLVGEIDGLIQPHQAEIDRVEAERREREERLQAGVQRIRDWPSAEPAADSTRLRQMLAQAEAFEISEAEWGDYAAPALNAREKAVGALRLRADKAEAEEAERARLAEERERERREREQERAEAERERQEREAEKERERQERERERAERAKDREELEQLRKLKAERKAQEKAEREAAERAREQIDETRSPERSAEDDLADAAGHLVASIAENESEEQTDEPVVGKENPRALEAERSLVTVCHLDEATAERVVDAIAGNRIVHVHLDQEETD